MEAYVDALEKEINICAEALEKKEVVHSIYIGGGTPSVLKAEHFKRILKSIRRKYKLTDDVEITSEANPYLLTQVYLDELHASGIHRLSMGMQTGVESELETLGRLHRMGDLEQSMRFVRQAGFENINLDLIFGIPNQTLGTLHRSLKMALDLEPEHLSIYSLTVEEGTPLQRMIEKGEIPQPDEDVSADLYAWIMQELPKVGFEQYEISNWARSSNLRSRHNLQYWRNGYYLGFGASAHSHYKHKRWANSNPIPDYVRRLNKAEIWDEEYPPAADEITVLKKTDIIQETMMMGLRLVQEGVDIKDFKQRFAQNLYDVYQREIDQLMKNRLLEEEIYQGRKVIRLTPRGRMLGNQVFMQFIQA